MKEEISYNIVGIIENYQQTQKIAVKIQVNNSARSFCMLVEDIYMKDWLNYFSKEDCTYLAVLYVAEKENKPEIIHQHPRKKVNVTTSVLILAIFYTSCLILSNIAGSKIVSAFGLTFPAVLVFFPFTYIIDDIITEVYGFKISKKIIWIALLANLLIIFAAGVVVYLPPSDYWEGQSAFEDVFLSSPRILLASIIAYVGGEFLNAICLAKLKVFTKGKYLWFRSVVSTASGCFFDSIIFCTIAFLGIVSIKVLVIMILTQYLFKIVYAFVAIPFVYRTTDYLKKIDNVDFYDYNTKFNPFSI